MLQTSRQNTSSSLQSTSTALKELQPEVPVDKASDETRNQIRAATRAGTHGTARLLADVSGCKAAGDFVADASSGCASFYHCTAAGQGELQACPAGTLFDASGCNCCNFAAQVQCAGSGTSPPASPAPDSPAPDSPAPDSPAPDSPAPDSPAPQSPAPSSPGGGDLASIVTDDVFGKVFQHTNDDVCKHAGFYTSAAFIEAAAAYPEFGTSKNDKTNRREVAAFFAQISHETTGKPTSSNDYNWGLCIDEEQTSDLYCQAGQFPCADGVSYHGRGPVQLSWNYNYGPAGTDLDFDGINHPEAVLKDATLAFKTAIRFWMTAVDNKPSCHEVMNGDFNPSAADKAAGRLPGFGTVTDVINGGLECGASPSNTLGEPDRIAYFKSIADVLSTDTGDNLSCSSQQPFGSSR